jgi:hypothetical protein
MHNFTASTNAVATLNSLLPLITTGAILFLFLVSLLLDAMPFTSHAKERKLHLLPRSEMLPPLHQECDNMACHNLGVGKILYSGKKRKVPRNM